jgi:hypothetical protein
MLTIRPSLDLGFVRPEDSVEFFINFYRKECSLSNSKIARSKIVISDVNKKKRVEFAKLMFELLDYVIMHKILCHQHETIFPLRGIRKLESYFYQVD